jgi:hypothetical protein
MAMLRPELFRVVLAAPGTLSPGAFSAGSAEGFGTAWTRPEQDWEP